MPLASQISALMRILSSSASSPDTLVECGLSLRSVRGQGIAARIAAAGAAV